MAGRDTRVIARLMGPIPIVVIAAVSAAAIVVGYGWGGSSSSAFWTARQAAVDPPQLWSIEAVPQPAGWRPARVCVDAVLRAGFTRPLPVAGGQPCATIGDPVKDPGRYAYRCELGGRVQGVSSSVVGDIARDFTATFTVTDLGGFLAHRDAGFQQVRRYRKLGACPADWKIGDHSDRHGTHLHGAVVDGNNL